MKNKRSNNSFFVILVLLITVLAVLITIRNLAYKKHISALAEPWIIGQGKPVLLSIGASWCSYCRKMGPDLHELSLEYANYFTVAYADADEYFEILNRHDLSGVPAQIFFDAEGNPLAKHQGYYSKQNILNRWTQLGINVSP